MWYKNKKYLRANYITRSEGPNFKFEFSILPLNVSRDAAVMKKKNFKLKFRSEKDRRLSFYREKCDEFSLLKGTTKSSEQILERDRIWLSSHDESSLWILIFVSPNHWKLRLITKFLSWREKRCWNHFPWFWSENIHDRL